MYLLILLPSFLICLRQNVSIRRTIITIFNEDDTFYNHLLNKRSHIKTLPVIRKASFPKFRKTGLGLCIRICTISRYTANHRSELISVAVQTSRMLLSTDRGNRKIVFISTCRRLLES